MKKQILILLAVGLSLVSKSQTIEEYYTLAAQNNPGLQAKYKSFEASLQKAAQVSSLPDPILSFAYFISPVETRVGPQQARFSLRQMFPWFGSLKVQEEGARLLAEAQYQEFLDARNKLYYQVAAAYYPLFELKRISHLQAENIKILSSYKDIATLKFQNGKAEMIDVLRVDIMLKDASTNLSILKQKSTALESRFNALINRSEAEAIALPDSLFVAKTPEAYRKDSLLLSNPLMDQLSLKIAAAKASEKAAVKNGLPQLGLGLDYVLTGQRPDVQLSDNGKDAIMPMISVSLPIFRKKYKAARREAQLRQESFTLQQEDLANRLNASYDMLWFQIQEQLELISLYKGQIQSSQQSLNLLIKAYANSSKDFEEVLRMQQQLLKYQELKATALSQYYIAQAELNYLTAKNQ